MNIITAAQAAKIAHVTEAGISGWVRFGFRGRRLRPYAMQNAQRKGTIRGIDADELLAFLAYREQSLRETPVTLRQQGDTNGVIRTPLRAVEPAKDIVEYEQFYTTTPEQARAYPKFIGDKEPRITVCYLRHDGVTDVGIAICGFDDAPNEKVGKVKALGRAKAARYHEGKPPRARYGMNRFEAQAVAMLTGANMLHLLRFRGKSFRIENGTKLSEVCAMGKPVPQRKEQAVA